MTDKKSKNPHQDESLNLREKADCYVRYLEDNGLSDPEIMTALASAYLRKAATCGFTWQEATDILIGTGIEISKTSEGPEKI